MCVDWIRAYCFIIVIIIAAHTTSNTLSGAFSFNRLLGKWGVMLVFSMTKCHRQVQAQRLCHSSAGSLAVSRCTGNREMCSSGNKNSQIQWENLSCTRSSSKVPHALIMPWAAAIWIKSANIWLNGDFFFFFCFFSSMLIFTVASRDEFLNLRCCIPALMPLHTEWHCSVCSALSAMASVALSCFPQADWLWHPPLFCKKHDGARSEDGHHPQLLCGLLHHGWDRAGILPGHVPRGRVSGQERRTPALHDTYSSGITSAAWPSQL